MFRGCRKPPVGGRPPKPREHEEYYEYREKVRFLASKLGFHGDDAEERLYKMWAVYGAAGEEPETPELQEARYAPAHPEGPERNPGLARNALRDPDIVATAGWDYLVKTWDPKTFEHLQTFEGHHNRINRVVQYQGSWLLSASDDGSCRLWRLGEERQGVCERVYWISYFAIKQMCLLPGQRMATSHTDLAIRITSLYSGEVLIVAPGHREIGPYDNYWQKEGCGMVSGLLHIRDNILASSSNDTTIRFWDVDTMRCIGIHVGHHGYGKDIGSKYAFTQRYAPVWDLVHVGGRGTEIASCSYDRTVVIWDIADIEKPIRLKVLTGHDNAVLTMALLGENVLLTCGADACFKIYDVSTGETLHDVETRGFPEIAVRLDDSSCAIGGGDATIRVFDWKAGEDLLGERGFYAHDMAIQTMAPVFAGEPEEGWLEPIMYRVGDPFQAALDQETAAQWPKHLAKQALSFSKTGEWGDT